MVIGLPMRLTETVDRKRLLYKGRRCHVHSWAPHTEEEKTELNGEFVAAPMPKVIYLQFYNAKWKIGNLPEGVYPLTARSRAWVVNKNTGIEKSKIQQKQ